MKLENLVLFGVLPGAIESEAVIRYTISMIPDFVAPFLWSYDVASLDLERDKKRIITNILNLGTRKATDWLFSVYQKEDIADCVARPMPGEWNKKSIALWSLLLDVTPQNASTIRRFV